MRAWLKKPAVVFGVLLLALLALRVPFFFTHHVQEDAYISLRCAESFAETGVYGFNPGKKVSASTSHLYVFLATVVRLIAGHEAFIPAVLVVNTLFLLAGVYFIARVLARSWNQALILWVCVSVLPISLLISYSGMETSLLIFVVGLVMYLMHYNRHTWLAWLGLALLPWVRPDALAYGLILLFWQVVRNRKMPWGGLAAAALGTGTLVLFNQLYFGSPLQQSINAKMLMRHSFSLSRLINNIELVFTGQYGGIFAPIHTKYLQPVGVIFLVAILAAAILLIYRNRDGRDRLVTVLCLVSISLAIPLAYAFGGVLYQWYFWPCTLLGYAFVLALLIDRAAAGGMPARLITWITVIALLAGVAAQWGFSYAWGMKEFAYRGGIGVWLNENSRPDERILLEPAGYIPYYSRLYTYDEVGLVSPQVVTYRQAYRSRWWMEFVSDFKPNWIIQRGHIEEFETYQGIALTDDEQDWFLEHYREVASFEFNPEDYTTTPLLIRLLSLGEADRYYVFHLK